MKKSFGRNLVCEPYTGKRGLKTTIKRGVAGIEQKKKVIGLKLLLDAKVSGEEFKAGDVVYVREETLYTHQQYSNTLECEGLEEPFVLIDFGHVDFVETK